MKRSIAERYIVFLFAAGVATRTTTEAFVGLPWAATRYHHHVPFHLAKAGSFFNPVPERDETEDNSDENISSERSAAMQIEDVLKVQRSPSKATEPSTINGIPSTNAVTPLLTTTASLRTDPTSSKPYVGVGPASLNDVTNPEYDDQGYTLYANERTGEKSRVFEALVEYPCLFTLKVVGANEGDFVTDILVIVAATCQIDDHTTIDHAIKHNGKWTSVTIKAPVQSAQMLYQLYEDVDRDPRVKFKF